MPSSRSVEWNEEDSYYKVGDWRLETGDLMREREVLHFQANGCEQSRNPMENGGLLHMGSCCMEHESKPMGFGLVFDK